METATSGDRATLWIGDELRGEESASLIETIRALLREGTRHFRIDLSAVRRIDSVGLGMLVNASRRVQEESGELALHSPSEAVLSALQAACLHRIFVIETSGADSAGPPSR